MNNIANVKLSALCELDTVINSHKSYINALQEEKNRIVSDYIDRFMRQRDELLNRLRQIEQKISYLDRRYHGYESRDFDPWHGYNDPLSRRDANPEDLLNRLHRERDKCRFHIQECDRIIEICRKKNNLCNGLCNILSEKLTLASIKLQGHIDNVKNYNGI